MYGVPRFYDHDIVAINQSDATIVICKNRKYHTIDLKACSENFKSEYPAASESCVGDRNIIGKYFLLHTSGVQTFIFFKKHYVFNFSGKKILSGNSSKRFRQFQNILTKLGYTTYDLT